MPKANTWPKDRRERRRIKRKGRPPDKQARRPNSYKRKKITANKHSMEEILNRDKRKRYE